MSILIETDELIAINEATQVIFRELLNLSDEARQRVLQSVTTQFGLSPAGSLNLRPPTQRVAIAPTEGTPPGDFSTDRTMSPKAFMLEKRPQSDVERVACLAYYLAHYRDTPHFKAVEISALNTEAAQQKLSNPSQSINNAATRGYLVPASKGQKQLSAAGEAFVTELPDRDAAKKAMNRVKPRRTKRKRSAPNSVSKHA